MDEDLKGQQNMNMDQELYLLIGTYTKKSSEGIYVYKFNTVNGDSHYVGMAEVDNPSYLTATPDGDFVYAVTENEDNPSYANALSFNMGAGELIFLNREETKGAAPCNIAVAQDGKFVITANYAGGSISVFPVDTHGRLLSAIQVIEFGGQGIDKERQDAPHLHCVKFSPDGKFLFATDLGTDKIYRFETDITNPGNYIKEESLMLFKVEDGSGPRHLIFHPSGKYVYIINELSGTVIGFIYEDGALTEFQTIQADELNAKGSGDIVVTPGGNYIYASNRLQGDGIAIFSVDQESGMLSKKDYQYTAIHPRNILVTPDGNLLLVANMESDSIEIYKIDKETGLLRNLDKDIRVATPVCLLLL